MGRVRDGAEENKGWTNDSWSIKKDGGVREGKRWKGKKVEIYKGTPIL